jgi:hypothetical protein
MSTMTFLTLTICWQHYKCNKFISDFTEGITEVEERKGVVCRIINQVQSQIKGAYNVEL